MPDHNIAVSVRDLSKSYTINHEDQRHTLASEALLHSLKNIGKKQSTETFWALKDVSFNVGRGDVVGIIGRNGAGKSTLLKILSRITEPTSGQIDLYGRVGSLLEVGTGFHPELTGRENTYLNGAILGMSRREIASHFDAIVDFSGVEKFLDTPVKRYSSGMYVRLAFAVAAHLEPEILIVDEVLAVGDAEFQKKCLGKMQDVAAHGRTVLFVSHNMSAVQQLCKTAILMRSGSIYRSGPTETVVPDYLSDAHYSDDGNVDLSTHRARLSIHTPIIQRLRLLSANGKPTAHFFPDEEMNVEFTLQTTIPIREPRLALAIEDSYGRRITTFASYFEANPIPDIESHSVVRCTIPRLALGTGRYLISVSIADKANGLLDSIDNAAWIEVSWRNNYNNGELYNPVYGPVLSKSEWKQINVSELQTASA